VRTLLVPLPRVPGMIRRALKAAANEILSDAPPASIELWAVHPGGTSVVDAVQRALDLKPEVRKHERLKSSDPILEVGKAQAGIKVTSAGKRFENREFPAL
jgi:predicted naringenin-chalcone synthase